MNVADGIAPTDAVNRRQLDQVASRVDQFARDANSGIASATALGMIPQADPGKRLAVGAGASFQW